MTEKQFKEYKKFIDEFVKELWDKYKKHCVASNISPDVNQFLSRSWCQHKYVIVEGVNKMVCGNCGYGE